MSGGGNSNNNERDQYELLMRHLPVRWEGGLARQEGAVSALLRGLARAFASLSSNTWAAVANSIPMTSSGIWLTLHLRSIGLERRSGQSDAAARLDYQFEFSPSRNTYAGLLRWLAYKAGMEPPRVRIETDYSRGKRGQLRVVVDDEEQDWQPLELGWVGPLVGRVIANGIIPSIDLRLHCLLQAPLLPWTFLDPLPVSNSPLFGPLWERRSFTDSLRVDEARSLFAQVTDSEWRSERLRLKRLHRESLQTTGAPGAIYVYLSDPRACPYLLVDYALPLHEDWGARPQVRPYDVDGFHYWDTFPRPPRCGFVPGPDRVETWRGNYPHVWRFVLGFAGTTATTTTTTETEEIVGWAGVAPRLYSPSQGRREQRQHLWVVPRITGIWPVLWQVEQTQRRRRTRRFWDGNFGFSATFDGSLVAPFSFYRGAGENVQERWTTRVTANLLAAGRAWTFATAFGRSPRRLRQRHLVTRLTGGDPYHCRFGDGTGFFVSFYRAAQVEQEWAEFERQDPGLASGPELFCVGARDDSHVLTWETWVETEPGILLVDGWATDFYQPLGSSTTTTTTTTAGTTQVVTGGDPYHCRFGDGARFFVSFYRAARLETQSEVQTGVGSVFVPFSRCFYCSPGERRLVATTQQQQQQPRVWAEQEWFYYSPGERRQPGQPQPICDSPPQFWVDGSTKRRWLEPETVPTWRRRGNFRVEPFWVVVEPQANPARPPQHGHNGWAFDQSFGSALPWLPLEPRNVDGQSVELGPVVPPQAVDPYRWYRPAFALFYYPAHLEEPARPGLPRLESRPWLAGNIARFDSPYWDPFLSCADPVVNQTVYHQRSQVWHYRVPCREAFTRRRVTRFYEIDLDPPWVKLNSPRWRRFVSGRWTLHLRSGDLVLEPSARWWTDLARQRRSPIPVFDQGQVSLALEFLLPRGQVRHLRELELHLDGELVHQRTVSLDLESDENLGVITLIRATTADPLFVRLPALRTGRDPAGRMLRDRDYVVASFRPQS